MNDKDDRSIIMTDVMTPEKVNFSGNVHGGYLLLLIDRVAYMCAARYCGTNVVTLSVNNVTFRKPVHVGELVTCFATVNFTGKTSLEVGIKVVAENVITKEKRHTLTCFYTMVSTDESLKPQRVKQLTINNELEERRFEEGKKRREVSIGIEKKHRFNKNK